jgi:hypothetical protein
MFNRKALSSHVGQQKSSGERNRGIVARRFPGLHHSPQHPRLRADQQRIAVTGYSRSERYELPGTVAFRERVSAPPRWSGMTQSWKDLRPASSRYIPDESRGCPPTSPAVVGTAKATNELSSIMVVSSKRTGSASVQVHMRLADLPDNGNNVFHNVRYS